MVATLAMSVLMIAGFATGVSPMPRPIAQALVAHTLGSVPEPALIGLAALAHLGYGASAGAILAMVLRRVTVAKTIGYGVVLWALMGLAWLPYLGWGLFGTGVTPRSPRPPSCCTWSTGPPWVCCSIEGAPAEPTRLMGSSVQPRQPATPRGRARPAGKPGPHDQLLRND